MEGDSSVIRYAISRLVAQGADCRRFGCMATNATCFCGEGIHPHSAGSSRNPLIAAYLEHRGGWFWGRFATQRGQAPSPQGVHDQMWERACSRMIAQQSLKAIRYPG